MLGADWGDEGEGEKRKERKELADWTRLVAGRAVWVDIGWWSVGRLEEMSWLV